MGAPILFCWSFPAQLKPLIDRCFCLAKYQGREKPISVIEGKRLALLVTAAGPVEGNLEHILPQFRGMVSYLRCRAVGEFLVPLCTAPDALGDDIRQHARRFAAEITAP